MTNKILTDELITNVKNDMQSGIRDVDIKRKYELTTSNIITIKKRLGINIYPKNKTNQKEDKELNDILNNLKNTYNYIQKIEKGNKNLNTSLHYIKGLIKN
eukprot:Pgem_evm1s16047